MTNKELIFYGGILLCIIYLFYLFIMQISKSDSRKKIIDNAKRDYDLAYEEFFNTKEKLFTMIENMYGPEKSEKVKAGTIWIGMPMHLLMVALGKPDDTKENIYKNKTTEKWYYGEYQTRVGSYKYKLEIILENDQVVGWKDLA